MVVWALMRSLRLINEVVRISIVAIALVLLPVADSFGAVATKYLSPSLVLRLLVYVLGCWTLATSRSVGKGAKVLTAATIFYFGLQPVLHVMFWQRADIVGEELTAVVKLLYFPFVLLLLTELAMGRAISRENLQKSLTLLGCLVILSLVLGKISGLGGEIKGRGSGIEATKGFMIGANEVGLMLLLTLPYVTRLIERSVKSVVLGATLSAVAYGLSGAVVFTKSSLAAAALSFGNLIRVGTLDGSIVRRVIAIGMLSSALGLVAVSYGPAIQAAFYAFAGPLISNIELVDVLSFIFRGRQDYVQAILPSFVSSDYSGIYFWFGSGEHFLRSSSVGPLHRSLDDATTFEMDGFDLFGSFGVIGVALYLGLLWKLIRAIAPIQPQRYMMVIIALVVLHSLLAGHVLFSPQVSSLLAMIIVMNCRVFATREQPA